ncbi:MAG TPA: translation initiation factor IF-3 [Verrucomicrobiales bacterium]|nr:translation initiation factor IF-3 [Verrucomicrobiales bacterium]
MRVNGKIRAREVRVIGQDGGQVGVLSLPEALTMARQQGVDLVEIAPSAVPPVCRLVDFGKYRYELAKREKESKKHQHSNKVKEIQLSPSIDPHDFGVKLGHAIDFLCDEMKVKVTLRFRGREMAHKEYGFQQVQKLIQEVAPYGHPDQPPKLVGKGITAMLSPLPRTKRAKNPRRSDDPGHASNLPSERQQPPPSPSQAGGGTPSHSSAAPGEGKGGGASGFSNNPFSNLEVEGSESSDPGEAAPGAPE